LKWPIFYELLIHKSSQNLWQFYKFAWWFFVNFDPAGVNFINVKHTNFSYERRYGSFYYVHVTREKLPKWRSYEKFVCLTLMKLTQQLFKSGIFVYWSSINDVMIFEDLQTIIASSGVARNLVGAVQFDIFPKISIFMLHFWRKGSEIPIYL